jgi:hypothetical protein
MFDDMIANLTGKNPKVLEGLCETFATQTSKVATMCSGTEAPILALDMLQTSIRDHVQKMSKNPSLNADKLLQIERVFSCKIEPFKQAYIERNFHPPLLFRDIRELGEDHAHTAYGSLVPVPNTPGCVDMLIAGTSCVDYSNLNNRQVNFATYASSLQLLKLTS